MENEAATQQLAHKIFLLKHNDVPDIEKVSLKEDVFTAVKADYMVPLYETLVADGVLELDQGLLDSMRTRNDQELKKLDDKIVDAEENLGESEVREAHLAKSLFFIRIGVKEKSLEQLKITETKTVAVGQKMDLVFYTLQLAFFYMDFDLISKSIEKAKNLFEEGGDWERKNRLKVYEGLYCMSTRDFKKAASLFLDSISTFTTYDLFTYDTFIFYTVLTSIITLDRVTLKQKVVDAPEILTVIGKIPHLTEFLNALYECQYKSFFSGFAGLTEQIKFDRYLHPHFRFYMREVRTVVYSQFLESYKSVTIEAMAKAFGVTVEFIDLELSRFISAGKLHCKIDSVAGVLETNRPDSKNALYQATIKQGDFLLNRIQKLSQVIDLDYTFCTTKSLPPREEEESPSLSGTYLVRLFNPYDNHFIVVTFLQPFRQALCCCHFPSRIVLFFGMQGKLAIYKKALASFFRVDLFHENNFHESVVAYVRVLSPRS
ncbi:hypothetical protein ACFE04_014073 [Oxalis oulophora]